MLDLNFDKLKLPPSPPLPNYLFRVCFHNYSPTDNNITLDNDNDPSMIAISVNLPSFDTKYVTKKFLGSEKSFPVFRSNAGETSLEFYTHSDQGENNFIVSNFFKRMEDFYEHRYIHKEFSVCFDTIAIWVSDILKKDFIYVYYLKNCFVTKIEQGQLSYEGSEAIKYTMTVHYDDWYISETESADDEDKNTSENKSKTNQNATMKASKPKTNASKSNVSVQSGAKPQVKSMSSSPNKTAVVKATRK
jgi:hypothetical protein